MPTRPDASTPAPSAPEDAVDRIVAQWHTQRPDLDPSPMQVFGRLHRIAERLSTQIEAAHRSPATDDLSIAQMKKEKLRLKEQITRLSH